MVDKALAGSPRIADLKRRLAAEPSSRLFLDLAREYHESGQLEKAAEVCARGLKYHPSYLSARVLLGRVLFDMGRVEESREAMEAVLALAPDNLVARRVLAEICLEQGDVAGALDRFRALLAFSPADVETKKRIDELEAKLGNTPPDPAPEAPAAEEVAVAAPSPSSAVEVEAEPGPRSVPSGNGEGVIDLEPGVLATPTLAEIYLQQGLKDKAARVYREILKGDPANVDALGRLTELEPPAPLPPDPADQARRRKIETLSSWLELIRGGRSV